MLVSTVGSFHALRVRDGLPRVRDGVASNPGGHSGGFRHVPAAWNGDNSRGTGDLVSGTGYFVSGTEWSCPGRLDLSGTRARILRDYDTRSRCTDVVRE